MTSLEYVKQAIHEGRTGFDYTEEELDKAQTIPGDTHIKPGNYRAQLSDTSYMGITIRYTPDNDFDYFSSVTSEHDGTMLFFIQDLQELAMKVMFGNTCCEPKARETGIFDDPGAFDVEMEIGDIVVIEKFKTVTNDSGFSFPGEKVSHCLPIKWNCHRREWKCD